MWSKISDSRYMQYLGAMTATLSVAALAMYSVWASPSLIKLQSEDSPIGRPITDEEGSWVVSLILLGGIPACFVVGPVIDKLGRKKTLLLGGFLLLIPWFMVMFGKSIIWLYVCRILAGTATVVATIGCSIYNGEIADNDIRGKLGTSFVALRLVGSTTVLAVGPYVSYMVLAIVSASMPLIFICLFSLMPESPYYLMKINDRANAERVVRILSSKSAEDKDIQKRLSEIERTIQEDMRNKATIWGFLTNKEYRKPLLIMLAVKTLHQFSGTSVFESYMQTIIEASGSTISSELSSVIFAIIQLPAVLSATFLVDRIGRRPLLILSSSGCAIALIAEGVYFYLQDALEADLSAVSWLPTVALALFLIMNPLGIATVTYVLLGELFATNIKGVAVSIIILYSGLAGFLSTKFFMPLANAWGIYTMFWIFASICILGLLFVYFFLPETKGKTFIEIQDVMQNRKRNSTDQKI